MSLGTLKLGGWPSKAIRHLFYTILSFQHHFKAICEFKLELQSGNPQFGSKFVMCLSSVTLQFDGWPWKTIGYLFCTILSFVHNFKAIGKFKVDLQSGNAQCGSKSAFFVPCDLEIRWMTLKNNRAPLLYNIKLCASFQINRWIQTGVTVRKRPIRVNISNFLSCVTLKFDGWPWKAIGCLFYAASSFVHHFFLAISEFKLELQPNLGQNRWFFFVLHDLEIWQMTLKNY